MSNQQTGDEIFEKFKWTIKNFSKLDIKKEMEVSKAFYIGGHLWKLEINCDVRLEDNSDCLKIGLVSLDLWYSLYDRSIVADFNLSLVNQVNAEETLTEEGLVYEFNRSMRLYSWYFIPLVELCNSSSGFIVNHTCVIEAEIAVRKPKHANQVANNPLPKEVCMSPETTELVDFKSFGKIEKAFVPLLEKVCSLHSSLVECQQNRTCRYTEWAFTALGRLLHFRKTTEINLKTCAHLRILWEELQTFNFDLTWLEPCIQWEFSLVSYVEKLVQLKTMMENLATLEMETKLLKEKIFAAQVDLETVKRDGLARKKEIGRNVYD